MILYSVADKIVFSILKSIKYGFLEISPGQAYPIGFSCMDFITIALSVTILTTLFSFITVKLLTRKQKES